ncbi:alkyl hydroperoxide reductase subunit F [Prevotella ihumii]|uniref:alkyl hydroperoxide reductase subunit F n=1 Tax=Prevotella ihumii TaxID=1917878 RepID=UPI000981E607|nr:alkyl hydroperoxide reductase subunit F [Prevotella ihumii]
MLDKNILEQVKGIFSTLKSSITLAATYNKEDKNATELKDFLNDFTSTSEHLSVEYTEVDDKQFHFDILKDNNPTGIRFRGIPNGHEFTSLLLAILNTDGQGKNIPDETIQRRIKSLKGEISLSTYVSLTCTNCPDVVQALNLMSLINPNIKHEMVDGGVFQTEVSNLNIQGVPAVYCNGKSLHVGRGDLGVLLQELEDAVGSQTDENIEPIERKFDVVVIGGGPAGASAAIYSARKGLRVGLVAERIGGQVNDTTGIQNLISVPETTGTQLASDLKTHLNTYPIELFEHRKITSVKLNDALKAISVKGGEVFKAPAVIIATGANWRRLNVGDEEKYIGHGIHFCQHCDGPFYKGKNVAVIGGGNSGLEAAIDLSGICNKVTVFEFGDTLRADTVLQEKAQSLTNLQIFKNAQTTNVKGDGTKLTALTVKDRLTEEEKDYNFDGVFVQIGLAANSDPFKEELKLTPRGEINVDEFCRTSIPGVYAAGDVTNVPYKQIVVAMGEGAKAALSAFDDRLRGIIS